ncbi:hypothetical protein FHX40_1206 [Thermopolyspora flexuosa]|uniref:Uncharacterized protein n=1 Tax=Thermopolyspora flexuosa TaxID=103836 RepID=A0A543IVD3_9ACTN|nr:hypothetical protein FHX40_1206 [Thermopolyspora flexuosa]
MQQGKRRPRRPARSVPEGAPLAGYGSRVSRNGCAGRSLGAGAEETL